MWSALPSRARGSGQEGGLARQLAVGSSGSGARSPSLPQAALRSPGRSRAAAHGFLSHTARAASRRCQRAPVRRGGVGWWSGATGIQSPGRPRSPLLGEALGNGEDQGGKKPTLNHARTREKSSRGRLCSSFPPGRQTAPPSL